MSDTDRILEALRDMREDMSGIAARNLSEHSATHRAFQGPMPEVRVELAALKNSFAMLLMTESTRDERVASIEQRIARLEHRLRLDDGDVAS